MAREVAFSALLDARDPASEWLARATSVFATAGWPVLDGDPVDHAAVAGRRVREVSALPNDVAGLVAHVLVEGALAQCRLGEAAAMGSFLGPPTGDFLVTSDGPHPYVDLMYATHARLLAWQGRIAEAASYLDGLPDARSVTGELLLGACRGMVSGNAADAGAIRALADLITDRYPQPSDHVSSGFHLLAGYGLLAVGDTARSAHAMLTAGGGPDLRRLTVIDRALSLEMLLTTACAEGDTDAAQAWYERLAPLASSPIANSTVNRAHARLRAHLGELDEALALAELALEQARCQGRSIEVAQSEVLISAIQIDQSRAGSAQRRLQRMVTAADANGHASARQAANRELRRAGRRLAPPRGRGWQVLSPRERTVALLMAGGAGNRAIAEELVLSEHTVRAHVSRVLAAYGLPSRTLLAAQLGERTVGADDLTPRQRQVAALVASGRRNTQIADELGITVRTVEAHVAHIMQRWGVATRAAIATRDLDGE